jgi:AraC-like DNA-binding protein
MWVHNEIIRNIAASCTAYGVQADDVLRMAGIAPDALADKDGKQDWRTGIRIWEAALQLTGYRFISLSFGRNTNFSVLGWIAPLTTSSPVLKLAWRSFADFFPLMGDMMEYWVEELNDGSVRIRYIPATAWLEASPVTAALAAEHAMSLTLSMSAYLCGRQVLPHKAMFMHTIAGKDKAVYKDLFGEIISGQEYYALQFDSTQAALPVISANALMYEQMQQLCAEKLQQLQNTASYTDRVLQALNNMQLYYNPKLDEIAAQLHTSPRTLQRKLKEEGTTYHSILEQHQVALATELLKQPATRVKEVAFALGFSDLAVFSRAYKRKTGYSPLQMQKRLS